MFRPAKRATFGSWVTGWEPLSYSIALNSIEQRDNGGLVVRLSPFARDARVRVQVHYIMKLDGCLKADLNLHDSKVGNLGTSLSEHKCYN